MKLLFVYNAKSGKLNALADTAHKLFSPSTYQCNLCALTYDTFSENKIWKSFRSQINLSLEFYHTDQFEAAFPNVNVIYPTILKLQNSQVTTVLNSDALNDILTVEELIEKLKISI